MVKSSIFGFLIVNLSNVAYTNSSNKFLGKDSKIKISPGKSFPNIDPEVVSEVVGKSHFDLDRLKELVDPRPELARATWEWRFGDWESAIGAASHVGRRDIATYLMDKGARPTIFTFAMLGAYEVVKSMIEFHPGIQRKMGPHGISLLQHARAGNRMKELMTKNEVDNLKRLIDYLERLGDARGETYLELSKEEQKKYLGDYKYGEGPNDGFSITLNMRNLISLGSLGGFGGALYRIGDQTFTYNGAPSVTITFAVEKEKVQSLTLVEPDLILTAKKVR